MHIHESKFLQQHVNSAIGLMLIVVMGFWTTLYYVNHKIYLASESYNSIADYSDY